jgi:hypothetical protein
VSNRTYHKRGERVHGYRVKYHPSYSVWAGMLQRCTNDKLAAYENYGGRGIAVCDRWQHFKNFAEDMGVRPSPELTIERIDNDGNYEPGNCKWETRSNQNVNRRTFSNNSSGDTGVQRERDRYLARFRYGTQDYRIGLFSTPEEATLARVSFVELFFSDRNAALASIEDETLWCTSSSGARGVTPHKDGGYMVRATINKIRHYVGYFQSFEEAVNARTRFIERRTGSADT